MGPSVAEPLERLAGRIDWIELVSGFACNCRCRICPSARQISSARLAPAELRAWLARGRALDAGGVWFGGGEPSLEPSLAADVERAAAAGYRRIRIQTNGLRFAYPAYARRLARAGLNEVSLSVKGAGPESHDAVTRTPGSFALVERAAAELAGLGIELQADVLITSRSQPELAAAVERFASVGCRRFTFWLVSLHGLDQTADRRWLPSLAALAPDLQAAFERAAALGVEARSLHTPPCVLAPAFRDRYHHAGRYRLLVVTPGQAPFLAEDSPMEGGSYVEACRRCAVRSDCLGLRADYLAVHGPAGIEPIL